MNADLRWLVVGHSGLLGTDLLAALEGRDVRGASRPEADVTDPQALAAVVTDVDVVVNCAAWTAVDDAESHEPDAFDVNAVGAANLARACRLAGARLVQVSTDYVFDGAASTPYAEASRPQPTTAYGRTKLAGEWAVRSELPGDSWVVRTAWLFGEHGPNFVRTMLALEASRDVVEVVDDQRGQPTWSHDLARQIVSLVELGAPPGVYHGTSSGETTWFGLARAVFSAAGADPERVRPTTTARFPRPARRPAYSVLGHDGWSRAGIAPIREWSDAVAEAVPRLVARS